MGARTPTSEHLSGSPGHIASHALSRRPRVVIVKSPSSARADAGGRGGSHIRDTNRAPIAPTEGSEFFCDDVVAEADALLQMYCSGGPAISFGTLSTDFVQNEQAAFGEASETGGLPPAP